MKTTRCFFLTMSFIFMLAWQGSIFAQTAEQPSGAGTLSDPYQVANLNNLYWITQNNSSWDKHFVQTANIDATATAGWDSNKGFLPIGSMFSNSFTGHYDGNGFFIDKLKIGRNSS